MIPTTYQRFALAPLINAQSSSVQSSVSSHFAPFSSAMTRVLMAAVRQSRPMTSSAGCYSRAACLGETNWFTSQISTSA